jgi:hypothetical protein
VQVGQRNRCLFELARYLRGRIPQASREELRALVMTWHDLALPVIGTKDFAITWADFLIRLGEGAETLWIHHADHHRHDRPRRTPLPPGIELLGYGESGKRLVRMCIALQAYHGDAPFFLSARQAGERLGLHFTDASRMLRALVADKVLVEVSKGAGNVASRYRFIWK